MNRRTAIQVISVVAFGGPALRGAPALTSWDEVFALPKSESFGIPAAGSKKLLDTWYTLDSEDRRELSFDISNSLITGSITARGELRRACICSGVHLLPEAQMKGGVYSEKALTWGGPWPSPITGDRPVTCELLGGVFPCFTVVTDAHNVEWLYFAPEGFRVILLVIRTSGANPALPAGVTLLESSPGLAVGALRVDDNDPLPASQRAVNLFRAAWDRSADRYGALTIPAAKTAAESVTRMSELACHSLIRSKSGAVCGGFLGSDVDTRAINWNKDSYYAALAASLFQPELCRDAIPFFLRWNIPPHPVGRGIARFPDAPAVTQSLSNALAPLALAGAYYKASGDSAWFLTNPEFLEKAGRLLSEVLASRRSTPMLFPSMFVSDGDARGDFHTGSNVVAWYAFRSAARLAREVYRETSLAARWEDTAAAIRRDLEQYCTGADASGPRFYEGVLADGTFLGGHDGEESDTNLMPFYGFCTAGDERLINHAHQALTSANRYYSKELDAIWWYNNGGFRPATFPGFITALAGARTPQETAAQLKRIEHLTDFDGSIWWWPYPYGARNPLTPLRANGARKCSWAAAMYLLRFVHDILGLDVDVPAATLSFRPSAPWSEFEWKGCRLGSAQFDISYNPTQTVIVNRNVKAYTVEFQLTPNTLPVTKQVPAGGTVRIPG